MGVELGTKQSKKRRNNNNKEEDLHTCIYKLIFFMIIHLYKAKEPDLFS